MTTCSDVMKREPVYCAPEDPVTLAADLMRRHAVASLPVVDASTGQVVGVVTDRDLVLKIVVGNCDAARATVQDAMTVNAADSRGK